MEATACWGFTKNQFLIFASRLLLLCNKSGLANWFRPTIGISISLKHCMFWRCAEDTCVIKNNFDSRGSCFFFSYLCFLFKQLGKWSHSLASQSILLRLPWHDWNGMEPSNWQQNSAATRLTRSSAHNVVNLASDCFCLFCLQANSGA